MRLEGNGKNIRDLHLELTAFIIRAMMQAVSS
jgi:hypothetical protein